MFVFPKVVALLMVCEKEDEDVTLPLPRSSVNQSSALCRELHKGTLKLGVYSLRSPNVSLITFHNICTKIKGFAWLRCAFGSDFG